MVRLIADAWTPYLGPELAEERARDAATVLVAGGELSEEHVAGTLTRCFLRAMREPYNRPRMSGSMVMDAIQAAVEALGQPD